MTDPTPVKPRTDEPTAAAASFSHDAPLQLFALPPVKTIEMIPPPDQMALELKALRQQALGTQAGIQQLQAEQQNQSFSNVLSARPVGLTPGTALLGIAILILGGILTWSGARRLRARPMGSKQEFIDSDSPSVDPQDSVTLRTHESARVVSAALPEVAPAFSLESEFAPVTARCEEASDLHVNLEDLLPINALLNEAVLSSPDKPAARINHAPEFDREAAADEVERVLKSLASKRAARSRRPQKTDTTISPEPDIAMMILPPFDPTTDQRRAADRDRTKQESARPPDQQLLTPPDEKTAQTEPRADAAWLDFDMQDQPVVDLQNELPIVPTATLVQDLDDEPDHEVHLSLAQEFEALGLTLGARELATEALDSPDPVLSSFAQALLRQLEDQDVADTGTQRSIF